MRESYRSSASPARRQDGGRGSPFRGHRGEPQRQSSRNAGEATRTIVARPATTSKSPNRSRGKQEQLRPAAEAGRSLSPPLRTLAEARLEAKERQRSRSVARSRSPEAKVAMLSSRERGQAQLDVEFLVKELDARDAEVRHLRGRVSELEGEVRILSELNSQLSAELLRPLEAVSVAAPPEAMPTEVAKEYEPAPMDVQTLPGSPVTVQDEEIREAVAAVLRAAPAAAPPKSEAPRREPARPQSPRAPVEVAVQVQRRSPRPNDNRSDLNWSAMRAVGVPKIPSRRPASESQRLGALSPRSSESSGSHGSSLPSARQRASPYDAGAVQQRPTHVGHAFVEVPMCTANGSPMLRVC